MLTKTSMIAVAALLVAGVAPAHAKMDCNKEFQDFYLRIHGSGAARLAGDKLADVMRQSVRAYDACQSGDDITPRGIWDKLLAEMPK